MKMPTKESDSRPQLDADATRRLSACLFGCPPDTGNLGVTALCLSALSALKAEAPETFVTVFDNGRGLRWGGAWVGGRALTYGLCGARHSKRVHRADSLANINLCSRLGGAGNAAAMTLVDADVLLDVSGGDSFTDLYGPRRFRAVVYPKHLAIELGIPLILLPQTYGPFRSPRTKRIASRIVRRARMAWARDSRSFEALKDLLGADFDPERHRCGVDLAFGLGTTRPDASVYEPVSDWLGAKRERPVIGFNVSGLVYDNPTAAKKRYGLQADYRSIVARLVDRFLEETQARILLVPHVLDSGSSTEGDPSACRAVFQGVADEFRGRVRVLEGEFDAPEAKYIIAKTDWFCGTRMHSTIAALSSGVPAAAIAYSGKTLGVFESCGQGDHVADPRRLSTEEVSEQVWRSWNLRDGAKAVLQSRLPSVQETCRHQVREIAKACTWPR